MVDNYKVDNYKDYLLHVLIITRLRITRVDNNKGGHCHYKHEPLQGLNVPRVDTYLDLRFQGLFLTLLTVYIIFRKRKRKRKTQNRYYL